MSTGILSSLFRRAPTAPASTIHFPYNVNTNPFRCKRTWPPDFSQLSQKHQFRLERRYRRRTKLKWARPTWTKITKLAQWGSIVFLLVYGVLYLELEQNENKATAFDGIRRWYREQIGDLESARERPGKREAANVQKG